MFAFGRALENELEKQDGKTAKDIEHKRQRVLNKWLDLPQKFKTPVATGGNPDAQIEQQVTVKGELT